MWLECRRAGVVIKVGLNVASVVVDIIEGIFENLGQKRRCSVRIATTARAPMARLPLPMSWLSA